MYVFSIADKPYFVNIAYLSQFLLSHINLHDTVVPNKFFDKD